MFIVFCIHCSVLASMNHASIHGFSRTVCDLCICHLSQAPILSKFPSSNAAALVYRVYAVTFRVQSCPIIVKGAYSQVMLGLQPQWVDMCFRTLRLHRSCISAGKFNRIGPLSYITHISSACIFCLFLFQNNPDELQSLIAKWRSSSQAMLYELQSTLSTDGKKLRLSQLIDSFGLDDQLLHYNRTEDDFTDT